MLVLAKQKTTYNLIFMKIKSIFAPNLFAFHYENNELNLNEYDRLMDLWTDISYLKKFADENNITDFIKFKNDIVQDAEYIQDLMDRISQNHENLEQFFRPLDDYETGYKLLSLQKGKLKQSKLRLYAIKIDQNLFVITGGAIKITHKMKDHVDTQQERSKLGMAKQFLQEHQIIDIDSFFEFLNEDSDE